MHRKRILALAVALAVGATATGGSPVRSDERRDDRAAVITDVCDGSERDPKLGVPVPADYDICRLTVTQPDDRRAQRLQLSLDMRQLPNAVTTPAVGIQVFWTLSNGCRQGFWRRLRADAGIVVELFERCDGDPGYRFVPGVVSTRTSPSTLTVVVQHEAYRPGTVVRPAEVFTEVSLFTVANPTSPQGRVHGSAGIADVATADPAEELRLRG